MGIEGLENLMPTHKTPGGYKYGSKGKVYKTKAAADKQGRAIKASQTKRGKGKK